MIFLYLFYTFCKIGLFGFGGGYAMLSMIQGEVVTRYNWISASEFTDIIAISQMTPGPIGINSATYVGYTAVLNAGYNESWAICFGSCISYLLLLVFPSFILMVIISRFILEIPKASGCRSRIQRVASGSSRSAGSSCTRLDEC